MNSTRSDHSCITNRIFMEQHHPRRSRALPTHLRRFLVEGISSIQEAWELSQLAAIISSLSLISGRVSGVSVLAGRSHLHPRLLCAGLPGHLTLCEAHDEDTLRSTASLQP